MDYCTNMCREAGSEAESEYVTFRAGRDTGVNKGNMDGDPERSDSGFSLVRNKSYRSVGGYAALSTKRQQQFTFFKEAISARPLPIIHHHSTSREREKPVHDHTYI